MVYLTNAFSFIKNQRFEGVNYVRWTDIAVVQPSTEGNCTVSNNSDSGSKA